MRFVVDGMLGSTARWLRMLGHETDYDPNLDDETLLQRSMSENAILLTRDEELQHRASKLGMRSILVVGRTEPERLAQVAKSFAVPLTIEMSSTRCPQCGSQTREISKSEASQWVSEPSVKLYDRFWKCNNSSCGKTYWVGSHWRKIEQTLEQARDIVSRD